MRAYHVIEKLRLIVRAIPWIIAIMLAFFLIATAQLLHAGEEVQSILLGKAACITWPSDVECPWAPNNLTPVRTYPLHLRPYERCEGILVSVRKEKGLKLSERTGREYTSETVPERLVYQMHIKWSPRLGELGQIIDVTPQMFSLVRCVRTDDMPWQNGNQ